MKVLKAKEQSLSSHSLQQGLEIENLSFLDNGPYGFSLEKGGCAGVLGKSGVGKTLFLKAIADIINHDGRIDFNGININDIDAPSWRSRVAFVAAESFWWFDLVADHFPVSFENKLLLKYLSTLGFSKDVGSWQVNRLSTGEKQRLSILRTIINRPDLLLLDEPTSGLDEELTASTEELLALFRKKHSTTIVWVSHSEKQLYRVADKKFIMHKAYMEEVV